MIHDVNRDVIHDGKPASKRSRGVDNNRPYPSRLILLEGAVLLPASFFLLVPELSPIATAAALIGLGLVWLVSLFFARPPSTPFDSALLLWGIALIVGVLVTADPAETLPKATGLILGLAVWRYAVVSIRTRRHVGWAVGMLILLGTGFTLVGIFGLQELPKIPALAGLNPFRASNLPGVETLTVHPNQLAGLISFFLPVLLSLLISPTPKRGTIRRLGLLSLVLWTTAVLILTQSRGGWIGAAMGLLALLAFWAVLLPPTPFRRVLRGLAALLVGLLLAAVLWIGPADLRDLWLNPPEETVVGTLRTLNYRKELWPWALTAVADFPLTGVGLGAFREVVFRLYPVALAADQDIGHAHNIFLQVALDTGLPGLAAYLAALFVAAAVGWRVARHDAGLRAVALGLLAGLLALHVFGLADALAPGSKPGVVFWLGLGILAAMNRKEVLGDA